MARPYKALRNLLNERDITSAMLARELGLGVAAVSLRLNDHYPWTAWEMWHIMELLNQPPRKMAEIFPPHGINEPGVKRGANRQVEG